MKKTALDRFAAFLLLNRGPLVLALISLFLLLFVTTDLEVESIESMLHKKVSEAVSIPSAEAVKFDVEGRDLMIFGSVPNKITMNQLMHNVSMVDGIRFTKYDVAISPQHIPYFKIFHEGQNQFRLEGELSQQSEIDSIITTVSRILPSAQLVENLTENLHVSDTFWYEIIGPALEQVVDVQNLTLEFGLGRVVLSGFMENQSNYGKMIRTLERLTTENDLKFVNRVGSLPEVTQ
ncbi:MAG: hypothetical protein OXF60_03540 [Gammaproteobacteria bacterium]|nr:hypothetical protein [Gammaproteobacteria bacterium]